LTRNAVTWMSGLRLTFVSRIAYAGENSANPFTSGSAKYPVAQASPCGKSAVNEMGSMQMWKCLMLHRMARMVVI